MISIGIDVSKSKSTVAALGFGKELIFKPFNIYHVKNDVNRLIGKIKSLDEDVKIVMEATEIYHIPILISLVNEGFCKCNKSIKMKRFCQALSLEM
ncbi:IS110 family transposase [Anaerococcus hydrogenalis]|nr:transposase [Anaerococcus hydrogenalis]